MYSDYSVSEEPFFFLRQHNIPRIPNQGETPLIYPSSKRKDF